jgi:hypothetical protein
MKGLILRGVAATAAVTCVTFGIVQAARADVWVVTDRRLQRFAASGAVVANVEQAFGRSLSGEIDVDGLDGSVWMLASGAPPDTPPPINNGSRLLHIAADGTPLTQFFLLGSGSMAIDRGRGGVWISRAAYLTSHDQLTGSTPYKLVLIDPVTGAERCTIFGLSSSGQLKIGADGAIWIRNDRSTFGEWTRVTGTVAELDGYDISSPAGPHHRNVSYKFNPTAEPAVDRSTGTLIFAAYDPARPGVPLLARVSPDALLLGTKPVRSFESITSIGVNSRDGSAWLADSSHAPPFQTELGANVAHYSSAGTELVTARHWDGIGAVTVDMTDESAWALVRFELDPEELNGKDSVIRLDAEGNPTARFDFDWGEHVASLAGSAPAAQREVAIDVLPSDASNRIDPASRADVAVAVLSNGTFKPTQVRVSSLRFGPAGAVARASWARDVNRDGVADLVAQFRPADTGIHCGDTQAPVTGTTLAGLSVHGAGSLQTVNCGAATRRIAIDVAPGGDSRNPIRPNDPGKVNVALLSAAGFDATRVAADSVRFGRKDARPVASWTRDVNGDGRVDAVKQFRITDIGLVCWDVQIPLFGKLPSGQDVFGADKVLTTGCLRP